MPFGSGFVTAQVLGIMSPLRIRHCLSARVHENESAIAGRRPEKKHRRYVGTFRKENAIDRQPEHVVSEGRVRGRQEKEAVDPPRGSVNDLSARSDKASRIRFAF